MPEQDAAAVEAIVASHDGETPPARVEHAPRNRPRFVASMPVRGPRRAQYPMPGGGMALNAREAFDLVAQAHVQLQKAARNDLGHDDTPSGATRGPRSTIWDAALALIERTLPVSQSAVFSPGRSELDCRVIAMRGFVTGSVWAHTPNLESDPVASTAAGFGARPVNTGNTGPLGHRDANDPGGHDVNTPADPVKDDTTTLAHRNPVTIHALQAMVEGLVRNGTLTWLQREGHAARVGLDGRPEAQGPIIVQAWRTADGHRGAVALVLKDAQTPVTELPLLTLGLIVRMAAHEDEARHWARAVSARERALRRVNEQQAETLLRHIASDPLTGLANRAAFVRAIDETTQTPGAQQHHSALLLLDLDHFKRLNDARGHAQGDTLLRHVARDLSTRIDAFFEREVPEAPRHTLARLGGDEFGLWIESMDALSTIVALVRELIDTPIDRTIDLDGTLITPSFSCGIAIYPYDGEDAETLLRHADAALFEAKQRGRAGFRFFTQEINRRVVRHFEIETALHRAIERHEFRVHYQPKIDLDTGQLVGAEALLRWQHPKYGLLLPGAFLAVAEDLTLIEVIGDWVWNTVCADLLRIETALVDTTLEISVNVSARQLRRQDLAAKWFAVLESHGIAPERLQIELTESALVDDPNLASDTFERLRSVGIPLAIDDFGTGHASLAQLKRLPIETIKIDRQFIDDLERNDESRKIVTAIVAMAKSLGLRIVAEGIETAEQARWVREIGCDQGQGFYYAEGLALDAFIDFVRQYGSA